jgi:hypothetical protein
MTRGTDSGNLFIPGARLRHYLIQELSGYQSLQASTSGQKIPASPTAHMLERPRHGGA